MFEIQSSSLKYFLERIFNKKSKQICNSTSLPCASSCLDLSGSFQGVLGVGVGGSLRKQHFQRRVAAFRPFYPPVAHYPRILCSTFPNGPITQTSFRKKYSQILYRINKALKRNKTENRRWCEKWPVGISWAWSRVQGEANLLNWPPWMFLYFPFFHSECGGFNIGKVLCPP